MEKLKMHTPDLAEENYKKLAALFPDAVTETIDENGNVVRAIDKDVLMQEINAQVVDDGQERYQFTWPDKRKSVVLANAPIAKTLRFEKEKSVGRDGTPGGTNSENIYIEGDNLDALKLLQETYLGKVKMIYIDPPYNTGSDLIYEDDFSQESEGYKKEGSGQYDDDGNQLVQNLESNGRFHTDWLNMLYPRLKIAKDFLSDDGVVFISIDDHEQQSLKIICNEIFGEKNYLAQIVWERAYSPINLMKNFSPSHDYILCYAKNIDNITSNGLPRSSEANDRYSNPDNDPRGPWKSSDLSVGPAIASKVYEIITPSGRKVMPPSGYCWRLDKEKFNEYVKDNRIWFGPDGNNVPSIKRFLSEVKQGVTPMTIWKYQEVGHSQEATQSLAKLFDGHKIFDYPKPVNLIERCLQLYSDKDSIILDFFSGSATTAQASMQLNAEDKGTRQYILVQLPEETSGKSEAFKAGYKTVCDIGEERIRRAGKKIKEETGADIDYGFRCFKVDSSNMKDVYYRPADIGQMNLDQFTDNIKEDRTPEDLLIQVMLDLGVLLSSKVEQTEIAGKKVFSVADGYLLACFDKDVTEDVVTAIAKQKPFYAVFRDSSMATDSVAANFEQIFATYSPQTVRKVL